MGEEFAKELFAHFFYCNPEKDEVSVLESLYFVLCPQYSCTSPEIGSTHFSSRVYPIFEKDLPDFWNGST